MLGVDDIYEAFLHLQQSVHVINLSLQYVVLALQRYQLLSSLLIVLCQHGLHPCLHLLSQQVLFSFKVSPQLRLPPFVIAHYLCKLLLLALLKPLDSL